jgi:hypothetical protein
MDKSTLVLAIVALGSVGMTTTASAQATIIPSPFHTGQWGIEAYADVFGNGGVTRFFTPQTALVLNLSTDHSATTSPNQSTASLRRSTGTTLDLALGLRHHTMVAPKIASTFAGGVEAGTTRQRFEYTDFANTVSRYNSTYAGAFAEFGGQYMIADHFAVGLAYRLSARHISNAGNDQRGWEVGTSFRPVRATLYF